jgi:hypothetical protein
VRAEIASPNLAHQGSLNKTRGLGGSDPLKFAFPRFAIVPTQLLVRASLTAHDSLKS